MIAPMQEVAVYQYHDAAGDLRYEVLRYSPKTFRQRQVDGHGGVTWHLNGIERVPYRLPEMRDRIVTGRSRTIFVVEGEKDADALCGHGFFATTNARQAGRMWLPGGHHHHLHDRRRHPGRQFRCVLAERRVRRGNRKCRNH